MAGALQVLAQPKPSQAKPADTPCAAPSADGVTGAAGRGDTANFTTFQGLLLALFSLLLEIEIT